MRRAGVAAIYGPGTRIPAAAMDMLRMLTPSSGDDEDKDGGGGGA